MKQYDIISSSETNSSECSNFIENMVVHYQPQMAVSHKDPTTKQGLWKVSGFEALVRMNVDGKTIFPQEFLKNLTTKQLEDLFIFVLSDVCQILKRHGKSFVKPVLVENVHKDCRMSTLEKRRPHRLSFSVNIEPEIISSERILSTLADVPKALRKHIIIEIVEKNVQDYDAFAEAIHYIAENLGFTIAMDDFGAGGNVFKIILTKNVKIVKLDSFFVPGKYQKAIKRREHILRRNVSAMLREMGIKIVAEQVETPQELKYILPFVDGIQGFLFGGAKPFSEWAHLFND